VRKISPYGRSYSRSQTIILISFPTVVTALLLISNLCCLLSVTDSRRIADDVTMDEDHLDTTDSELLSLPNLLQEIYDTQFNGRCPPTQNYLNLY